MLLRLPLVEDTSMRLEVHCGFFEHVYFTTESTLPLREYLVCICASQTGQRSKPVAMWTRRLFFLRLA